jgi:hypothetical protein
VVENSGKGLAVLNSANVRAYNNTFVNAPVVFERNERVAAGDVFDWHATTGPDLEQREGHVFVHNLMATDDFRFPLLGFIQKPTLCGKLEHPEAKEVDGNVYIRSPFAAASGTTPPPTTPPLIAYAPTAGENCSADAASLAEFRKLVPGFETNGVEIDQSPRSVLKGPDLKNFELQHAIANAPANDLLPADVRALLGWNEAEAKTPGAYPLE